jgi:hypothetical protein
MDEKFRGNCHCGSVQFRLTANLTSCMKCNCSFCIKRASILIHLDESKFELASNENDMGVYGTQEFSDHYFCRTCGIHCYTRYNGEYGKAVIVNVGCLEGVDSYSLNPAVFDGATKL